MEWMMRSQMNVLIVGGGIAGMACAIELAKLDVAVTLIDLDPNWRVYGAGITITGPTFRAFREIGIMDEVIAQGFACRGARTRLADGTLLGEVAEIGLEPGIPYGGGILRPLLHRILADRVRAAGVTVRLGITIEDVLPGEHDVEVTLSDGATARFDLMVGADGINSRTRALLFSDMAPPRFTGQGAWRVLAPRPPELDMIEMYLGQEIKAGVTPVSKRELYMFVLTPETDGEIITQEEQPARLRHALAGFGGAIGTIRDSLGPDSAIVYRPLQALLVPKPWHRGRVVLVGDAAHSTTPHLASGAGCAAEDGVVLAQELKGRSTVEEALDAFAARRFERCRDVVETSVKLGEMEQTGAPGEEQGRVYAEANMRLAAAI
jgi:2-polyprenyl-6-methoxyphenol hydroxylase-like FAD-dependent oxidoreductase